ncbi:MAG: hypothetical protein ACTSPY_10805 [Candidatus Helarchaeota archaeon]
MENTKQIKFFLNEADESFDRSIRYALKYDDYKQLFNLIMAAAFYKEAGLKQTVKNILMQMIKMDFVCNSVKKEIMDFLNKY